MTQIIVNDEIVHAQFGIGKVTRLNGDFVFAQFDSEGDQEKIVKAPFIVSVNGNKTHYRDSSKTKTKNVPSQKDRIYDLLIEAGDVGVNSTELLKITHRFSAPIHNLRNDGCDIKTISNPDGTSTFILKKRGE